MLVANDAEGNRIYASKEADYNECFCPICGERVKHKNKGTIRNPYFAHEPQTDCRFGLDKDYKQEWHIRMEEYFPKESREYRFIDVETGEIHIADVFLQDKNTVLEFQHSAITEQEFLSRTLFHIKNGRRIAWLFDESMRKPESSAFGKFREDDCCWEDGYYSNSCFRWHYKPRKAVINGPKLKEDFAYYSICVYTGTEGDVFHRIVGEHCSYDYVTFSLKVIVMSNAVNVDEFFEYDNYWVYEDAKRAKLAQCPPIVYKPRFYVRRNKGHF